MNTTAFKGMVGVWFFWTTLLGGMAGADTSDAPNAKPATPETEDRKTMVLPLKPVEGDIEPSRILKSLYIRYIRFDNQQAETPFAVGPGKLKFQVINGKIVPDRNLDGIVDEKDGAGLELNEVFRIPVKIGGKEVSYPIKLVNLDERSFSYAAFMCNLVLTAQSETLSVKLYDRNLNGIFAEPFEDLIAVNNEPTNQLNRQIAVGERLYDFKLIEGGTAIELTPYEGAVALLKVEINQPGIALNLLLLHNQETNNGVMVFSTERRVPMVPGDYPPVFVQMEMSLKNGSRVNLSGSARDRKPAFTLKPGENTLKIGPPLKLDFAAYRRDENQLEFTGASLIGAAGEKYSAFLSSDRVQSTLTAYVRNGPEESKLCTLEYG